MPKEDDLGGGGASSRTQGPHELKPEHMKKTNAVIDVKSVPPPDEELLRRQKPKDQP